MDQNLYFNIIPFRWPSKPITMYFHHDAELHFQDKLHKSVLPNEIHSILGDIPPQTEFIACSSTFAKEGFKPLAINFQEENKDFIKRYYNEQINYYFRKKDKQIIKKNFIKENQIWVPLIQESNTTFDVYEKFTLSVKIAEVSEYPELQLSFEGKTKILKKSVSALSEDVQPNLIKWVLYKNKISKLENILKDETVDLEKVFPVVNNALRSALGFEIEAPLRDNKYKRYMTKVASFYNDYLNNENFKSLIPLSPKGFLKVSGSLISRTSDSSNKLSFGRKTGQIGSNIVPNDGLKIHGPFKKSEYTNVEVFYILHKDDGDTTIQIHSDLHKGISWFKGLQQYAGLFHHVNKDLAIIFHNKENPIDEIETALQTMPLNPDTKYFAIYITPHSKNAIDLEDRKHYYKVKEILLKRAISSQVLDPQKYLINPKQYIYSLTNISVAILAKLGGIPWQLETQTKNELIVGVGAFTNEAEGVKYVASAFSFQNTGKFNNFECFLKADTDLLAGSIGEAVRNFTSVTKNIERLVIHFYKTMSEEELAPIEKELNNLNLHIPVFIVSINKTESEDIIVYDNAWSELMPISGTYINLGKNKYLLCNNTRYFGENHKPNDGYPFPIKLKIDCTDKTQLEDTTVIRGLIDQVYQFSRLYYKSVRQQNLPVTIKYPEMVAQIAPHFDETGIPDYGKDNLWFL